MNNMAVAFMVAGLVGPYFKVTEGVLVSLSSQDTLEQLFNKTLGSPTYWKGIAAFAFFAGISAAFAYALRRAAHRELEQIED